MCAVVLVCAASVLISCLVCLACHGYSSCGAHVAHLSDFAPWRVLATRSKSDAWHDEDKESYAGWLRDLKPGDVAAHDMLPLVWSSRSGKRASAGATP